MAVDYFKEASMEDAILNVVRGVQGNSGVVELADVELAGMIHDAYPHLSPTPGEVAELVRHLHAEGRLRIVYAEGTGTIHLRVPG
jgi:hypothetical protein